MSLVCSKSNDGMTIETTGDEDVGYFSEICVKNLQIKFVGVSLLFITVKYYI